MQKTHFTYDNRRPACAEVPLKKPASLVTDLDKVSCIACKRKARDFHFWLRIARHINEGPRTEQAVALLALHSIDESMRAAGNGSLLDAAREAVSEHESNLRFAQKNLEILERAFRNDNDSADFELWFRRCSDILEKELGLDGLLGRGDPYDCLPKLMEAYMAGQGPRDIIEELFAEDFAKRHSKEA